MNPQAPAPAPGPVSDNAAMASLIGQIPGAGTSQGAAPNDISMSFDEPAAPLSIIDQPQPPLMPQAPAGPPQYPQAPVQPQYAQPTPQQPTQFPQATPQAPPAAPPTPDPNYLPPVPVTPPSPATDPNAPPAWAAGLIADNARLSAELQQLRAGTPAAGTTPDAATPPAPAWEPTDWSQVDARIEARARELVQQGLTQAQADAAAAAQAAQEQQTAQEARVNDYIDNQVTAITQQGYIPPIMTPNDPNDPGRLAQQELFAYAISLDTNNLAAVAPTLYAAHQNGYYFDRTKTNPDGTTGALVRRGSQTAAAQSPIAGASPTLTSANANSQAPTMRELQTLDMSALAERAAQAYPLS